MISPQTRHLRSVKYLLQIIAIVGLSKLKNHDEPNETTVPEGKEDEARKKKEEKKKSRQRKRGPYRKAHANW
jgi:hypothetical protein